MNVCAYGGGVNSTAMLIGMVDTGEPVDLILFADTGGERHATYVYRDMFSDWLVSKGYPSIITVRNKGKTLEQDCLDRKALPSIAYGFKTCSQRWKARPQDYFMRDNKDCQSIWVKGGKVTKLIGFDSDEPHRAKDFDDPKYLVRYPLIEWDWGRDECLKAILTAGLQSPGKSACFFCPSSRPHEVKSLNSQYPDLARRCIEMENNAELTSVKGLGRNWAWADLLATDDMFPDEYPCRIDQDCGCYDG